MNGLDLFSGIGGLTLALEPWVTPISYCENERYAQAVLLQRMQSGELPIAPIWDDVRTLSSRYLPPVDVIYGGFPCQDISVAGRGAGLAGERSGLFNEILRLTKELRPAFVFLENVPAIRTRGLGRVVSGLALLGYDCRWTIVSAAEVGAPHLRKRWFLLAHANGYRSKPGISIQAGDKNKGLRPFGNGKKQSVADAERFGCGQGNTFGSRSSERNGADKWSGFTDSHRWWAVEPNVGRVVNGLPHRVDRLRGLGNAVVPTQAREAFMRLAGFK